jgi:hypothetical protein
MTALEYMNIKIKYELIKSLIRLSNDYIIFSTVTVAIIVYTIPRTEQSAPPDQSYVR